MRESAGLARGLVGWRACTACAIALWASLSAAEPQPAAAATLQDAIKARTEVTVLQQDCQEQSRDVLGIMRKVVAKADSKATEANILLTKDRYPEAVAAFDESAKLYRQVVDGKKLLEELVKAERAVTAARLLAEAAAEPATLTEPKKVQINAEGYLEAGEFELALAEMGKACAAFMAVLPKAGEATLDAAVAARTAMLSARGQIKGLARLAPAEADSGDDSLRALRKRVRAARGGDDVEGEANGPKAGSLADLLGRARDAEGAAGSALEERQYAPARALFAAAEKLYRDAAVLQQKHDALAASRQSVEENQKLADAAFKGEARPASFERGKQALTDADKALTEDDFEAARKLLSQAAEQFAAARADAGQQNAMLEAQQGWAAALAAADEDLLNQHAAEPFKAAKAKAAEAEGNAAAGDPPAATALFKEATAALAAVVADAKTKANLVKAAPVVQRLEAAIAAKDRFAAEDVLAEVEQLIPNDARLPGLREKVGAVPGPKKSLAVDLGGGVGIEFVLIRPGSFSMGSEKGEKPVHKVTIGQPFYLGKYEVTQEQWQALMGANPSQFKDAKNPVENVSWEDCQAFVEKLNAKAGAGAFRLPTEAEWEYACRAGTSTEFCFGDTEAGLGEYGWHSGNSESKTHPVGVKKPNAWGLYDMHGNVWEWCQDWYGDYSADAATDPKGPEGGSHRVGRGGAWIGEPAICRAASRRRVAPGFCYFYLGCRLVRTVP